MRLPVPQVTSQAAYVYAATSIVPDDAFLHQAKTT